MVSEKTKETIRKLEYGNYTNNRVISLGGADFSARDLFLKAPLIAKLNAYYVGGTGRGKTQLGNDLVGIFGDSSCYVMGRPDFEPSELFKRLRLDKLKDAKTDRELVELTENIRKNLFFVDELNRCPPIVQNYFFDFGDGKLVYDGRIYNLGTEGYSILISTGNIGDGEYVGISDSDRALKDRMHIIAKLDHPEFRATESDSLSIYKRKKNPRADIAISSEAKKDDILNVHKEFLEREINPIIPFLGVYLSEGLDWLENVKGHSKIVCDARWPNVEGIRTDNDEDKIFPISPRAVYSAMSLTSALEMIAEARENKTEPVRLFLDSLRFIVPYSGVLSPAYVDNSFNGDVYGAFDSIFGEKSRNREDILKRADRLEEAIAFAEAGIREDGLLREISPKKDRWAYVRRALEDYTEENVRNMAEERKKLKDELQGFKLRRKEK